jgi:hypothetical protein
MCGIVPLAGGIMTASSKRRFSGVPYSRDMGQQSARQVSRVPRGRFGVSVESLACDGSELATNDDG